MPDPAAKPPKAADRLAAQLRARLSHGEWPEGTRLPPERELGVQSGLSRASVREALRILEMEGRIEVRPGRGGGSVVRSQAHGTEVPARPAAVREARAALESALAGLAAEHRTDADLAGLAQHHKGLAAARGNLDQQRQAGLAWRRAVAAASHNEVLTAMLGALPDEAEAGWPEAEADAVLRAQARIMDAIARRDPEAAVRRMGRHRRASGRV